MSEIERFDFNADETGKIEKTLYAGGSYVSAEDYDKLKQENERYAKRWQEFIEYKIQGISEL